MTTMQTNTNELRLSEHDQERSSGIPFFFGVLGYLIALPTIAITIAAFGIV